MAQVEVVMDRLLVSLEELIRRETAVLKAGATLDLSEFNRRKSQGLYNLSAVWDSKMAKRNVPPPVSEERLRSFRTALEANQAALSLHLQAVREIADVISNAMRQTESDGTYDPARNGGGSK